MSLVNWEWFPCSFFLLSDCLDSVMDVLDSMSWVFATAGFGDCLCGGCSSFPVVTLLCRYLLRSIPPFFFFFGNAESVGSETRSIFALGYLA